VRGFVFGQPFGDLAAHDVQAVADPLVMIKPVLAPVRVISVLSPMVQA